MGKSFLALSYPSLDGLPRGSLESLFVGGSCKTFKRKSRHPEQAKRDPESRFFGQFWIPAFAGMTEEKPLAIGSSERIIGKNDFGSYIWRRKSDVDSAED